MHLHSAILVLAAASLAKAENTVTVINLDETPRKLVWTVSEHLGFENPKGDTNLPGFGTTRFTMIMNNTGHWSGNMRAKNGTELGEYALAEFTYNPPGQDLFFDVSWNACFEKNVEPDPYGVKMMISDTEPHENSGCIHWGPEGCLPPQGYWRDKKGEGTISTTGTDITVLVGGYGPAASQDLNFQPHLAGAGRSITEPGSLPGGRRVRRQTRRV